MGLHFALEDLVRATLPSGWGQVGFVGVSPDGAAYHVLSPVEVDLASDMVLMALAGRAEFMGGRPGWRYHYCHTYQPPPGRERPGPEAMRAARRRRARHTGRMLVAWARRQGWWAELSEDA